MVNASKTVEEALDNLLALEACHHDPSTLGACKLCDAIEALRVARTHDRKSLEQAAHDAAETIAKWTVTHDGDVADLIKGDGIKALIKAEAALRDALEPGQPIQTLREAMLQVGEEVAEAAFNAQCVICCGDVGTCRSYRYHR